MSGSGDKFSRISGVTLLEALMATAVVAIGFIAVFQMVNYSVQSIDSSSERTKANYLVSMVAEDLISDKNSLSRKDLKCLSLSNCILWQLPTDRKFPLLWKKWSFPMWLIELTL